MSQASMLIAFAPILYPRCLTDLPRGQGPMNSSNSSSTNSCIRCVDFEVPSLSHVEMVMSSSFSTCLTNPGRRLSYKYSTPTSNGDASTQSSPQRPYHKNVRTRGPGISYSRCNPVRQGAQRRGVHWIRRVYRVSQRSSL
jgi:hypothetical protein